MTLRTHSRRGVALFAALAVLGILALLVGGMLAAFRLTARSSEFSTTDAMLTAAADYALDSMAASARSLGIDTLPLGVSRTFPVGVPGTNGLTPVVVEVVATRLVNDVAWLVADVAASGITGGHRRINLVARWRIPGRPPLSALVSRGSVRLAAGVTFTADSSVDAECGVQPAVAVTLAPGASVSSVDSVATSVSAKAADASTYLLAPSQLAQLTGAPGVARVSGDTAIAGGSFEGILIVDGSLTITGTFRATGLVVSRGPIHAAAGGLVVRGALMSFALPPNGQQAVELGPSSLRYSPCVVAAMLRKTVPLRPVRERSWAELF
jgi:hypothetical protein